MPGRAVAGSLAWQVGKEQLAQAISHRSTFAFETTLGGRSITDLLLTAPGNGMELIWYVALANVDAHIARMHARVAAGGHDIPIQKIRARYDSSRLNLVRLLPVATSVRVFDNSVAASVTGVPSPVLVLEMREGRISHVVDLPQVPEWAKPIVAAAIREDLGWGAAPAPR